MRPQSLTLIVLLTIALTRPALAQQAAPASRPLASATGASTSTSDAEAKRNDIRKLIEITGVKESMADMLPQIIAPMKSSYPQMPDRVWQELAEEFKVDDLVDRLIPVYEKYYTRDDIRGIIAFYQSPLGRKLIAVQSQMAPDILEVSQEYARDLAQRLSARLKKEGVLKESDSEGAKPGQPPKNP